MEIEHEPIDPGPALSARDFSRLAWLSRRLPRAWTMTRRRRRFLFLGFAAPGFLAVFGTTFHHNFFVLAAGFVLFALAVLFRALSEPLFVQATAADLLPLDPSSSLKDIHHA